MLPEIKSHYSPRPLTPEPARQSPDGSSRMADGRSDGEQATSPPRITLVHEIA